MGWSKDLITDYTQTNVVVQMDSVSKSIMATFSEDADGDKIINLDEIQSGCDPRHDDSAMINYIKENGEQFDLYPSNVVLDVAVGQMLLQVDVGSGNAVLGLQLEQSDDLVSWTNAGDQVKWELSVGSEKEFFRVRAASPEE
jgi:hypothetical protein